MAWRGVVRRGVAGCRQTTELIAEQRDATAQRAAPLRATPLRTRLFSRRGLLYSICWILIQFGEVRSVKASLVDVPYFPNRTERRLLKNNRFISVLLRFEFLAFQATIMATLVVAVRSLITRSISGFTWKATRVMCLGWGAVHLSEIPMTLSMRVGPWVGPWVGRLAAGLCPARQSSA